MKKITLTHDINCSEEKFWEVFFDKEFNEALFRKELGFPEYDIVSFERKDNGEVYRRVKGKPKMDVPKAVAKVLGDSFGYEEEGKFDPAKKTWSFEMHPNTLAGKLINTGVVRVESIDANKCRRVADLVMEAKIFGVGGLLESTTEKEMRSGWDKSAGFMNRWLTEH
jgi:hypothetical protein